MDEKVVSLLPSMDMVRMVDQVPKATIECDSLGSSYEGR